MSQIISPSAGRKYGIRRVCLAFDIPRSGLYSRKVRAGKLTGKIPRSRRGPKGQISDDHLLRLIRHDLENSLFSGEGHRKVHARIQRQGYRVGRARVLRLMKEHNLLSPHRVEQGRVNPHEGRITTDGPDQMWGVDGVKVETVDNGWTWVFWAIEHWNAECVGYHVAKKGDRFAALEPVSQGVLRCFGSIKADVAKGLKMRMDHGSQYLSADFRNQLKYWGIGISKGFVREPETNGVVERFNRTFKEQIIHGRVYRNVEELRVGVKRFIEEYNSHWLLEKLGYKSPLEAREERETANSAMFAEGEEDTATVSSGCRLKGDKEISEDEIHRVSSGEEDTATALQVITC